MLFEKEIYKMKSCETWEVNLKGESTKGEYDYLTNTDGLDNCRKFSSIVFLQYQ